MGLSLKDRRVAQENNVIVDYCASRSEIYNHNGGML